MNEEWPDVTSYRISIYRKTLFRSVPRDYPYNRYSALLFLQLSKANE
nr:MAG TPA: hypothetical protein [Caudoviricetes sp.]